MSAVFGDEAETEVEKLKRAGAPGRTLLAVLPKDSDGGIDRVLTPHEVIKERFPPPHKQMPTFFKPPDTTIIEALPAETVGERFPKEGETGVRIRGDDLGRWLDYIRRRTREGK